jgi:hypothetical protein
MMRDQDIERVLDRWFTEGPTQMPERFLDDTLGRIDRAPSGRLGGLRTRWLRTDPGLRSAAAAAVVLAVAGIGAGLLIRTGGTGGPLSAGSGTLPASLHAEWHPVGDHPLPFMHSGTEVLGWDIVIGPTSLTIQDRVDVHSTASLVGPDQIELLMLDVGSQYWHCHVGDAGTYEFRLSSGGLRLTLTPVSDACTDRAVVLQGDWTRTDIGPLQAGRHEAANFRPFAYGTTGRLAYTVPDGWAGGPDMRNGLFELGRPSESDSAGITLISNAYASDQVVPCDTNAGAAGVGRTPEALSDWLRTLPGLVVSPPTEVTVGGLRGIMVDLSMAPGWTPTCDAGLYTFSLSGSDGGDWSSRLSLTGAKRARYILLDRGDGSSLVIAIEAPTADWDTFLADANPVIDGLEFTR